MIDCSCNVISDKQFKQAVENKRDLLETTHTLKKAVGIVYHGARLLQDEDAKQSYRKPCRSCFESVAQYIQDAGFHANANKADISSRDAADCETACGTSCNGGACPKAALF